MKFFEIKLSHILFYGGIMVIFAIMIIFNHNYNRPIIKITFINPPRVTINKIYTTHPYINPQQLNCLAKNIYFEAANQSFEGKLLVGIAVMERVKLSTYPDSICGVVHDAITSNGLPIKNLCQFSWFCDGKSDKIHLKNPIVKKAWEESLAAAKLVLLKKLAANPVYDGMVQYHAIYVHPAWARSHQFKEFVQVGDHIFYTLRDRKRT